MPSFFKAVQSAASNIYGALSKVTGGLWPRWNGLGWSRIRTFLPSARFDWEREAADTWQNSIVGLGIAWLGDRFPRPAIHVSKIARNGDHIPLGRHDAIDLWNRPNKFYSRRTLEKAVGLSLKCDGNAFIYKVRSRGGKVAELWWIPHWKIMPTWPADGSVYIDGYRVQLDTVAYHIPPEDIIHIRDGIDPRNERLGLSALRANLREVVTVNYEASYTAGILKNGGVPGLVIAPDTAAAGSGQLRPSPDDAKRIKERFNDEFGVGNDKAGQVMVMAGPYKVTAVGFSPEAMRLDRLPLNAIGRISASIGVAPMSVGLPDPGKTYSNLAEANKSSWGTIVSMQELIAESLQWELLPEFGLDPNQYCWEYDYSNIQELQETLDSVHSRAREDWKAGVCTLNEAREAVGRDADPDGDRYFPNTGSPDDVPAEPAMAGLPGVNGAVPEMPKSLSQRNGWHE